MTTQYQGVNPGIDTIASIQQQLNTQVRAESFIFSPQYAGNITGAIQAALNQSGYVSLTTPGTYQITQSLVIRSNTRFVVGPGVTIQMAGTNNGQPVLINYALTQDNTYVGRGGSGNQLTAAAWASTSGTVITATTDTNHGLNVGDWVVVANCQTEGYAGIVQVASVPAANQFTYVSDRNASSYGISATPCLTSGHTLADRGTTVTYTSDGTTNVLTSVTNTGYIQTGCQIQGANIPANAYVTAVGTNTLTISANTTGAGSGQTATIWWNIVVRKCDVNIVIEGGGTFDYNKAGVTNILSPNPYPWFGSGGVVGFGVCFVGVRNMVWRDCQVSNAIQHSFVYAGIRDGSFDNVVLDDFGGPDGMHVYGPIWNLRVTNLKAKTTDNPIAIGTTENDIYRLTIGPITGVHVSGVENFLSSQIRVLGDSENWVEDVVIEDVYGQMIVSSPLVSIFNDPNTSGGGSKFRNIKLKNIAGYCNNAAMIAVAMSGVTTISGCNTGSSSTGTALNEITVSSSAGIGPGFLVSGPGITANSRVLSCQPYSSGTTKKVLIDQNVSASKAGVNLYFTNPSVDVTIESARNVSRDAGGLLVNVTGCYLENLTLRDCHVEATQGTTIYLCNIASSGKVEHLNLEACSVISGGVSSTNFGRLIDLNGTVGTISINGCNMQDSNVLLALESGGAFGMCSIRGSTCVEVLNIFQLNSSTFTKTGSYSVGDTILNLGDTTGISVGATISGTNIPGGTTVTVVKKSSITISAATVTAAVNNATLTFGVINNIEATGNRFNAVTSVYRAIDAGVTAINIIQSAANLYEGTLLSRGGAHVFRLFGWDLPWDVITNAWYDTTVKGQFITSTRTGAANQGPAVYAAAGGSWIALGTGAAGANTVIA